MVKNNAIRRFFRYLNTYFMVPLFRQGLGAFMCNPWGGYIMVLKTIGRKTGQVRYTPVNYALLNGNIYCLAGFGEVAHWYRNLQAHPELEVILPGGVVFGVAETVTEAIEILPALRQTLKNSGFAAFAAGVNPYTMSEAELWERLQGCPLVRIRPRGVGSGVADPGGWLWLWPLVLALSVMAGMFLGRAQQRK